MAQPPIELKYVFQMPSWKYITFYRDVHLQRYKAFFLDLKKKNYLKNI